MMGAAHSNLAGQPQSPPNDAKLSTTAAVGFSSVPSDEKGFGQGPSSNQNTGALGIGAAGRLGLDPNGNALQVHKRPPKEETV